MNHNEAIRVLKLHQEWRMGRPPYDKAGCPMPHSPKGLTAALDYAIAELEAWQGVAKQVETMAATLKEARTNDDTH
jgi:hypothetical protein